MKTCLSIMIAMIMAMHGRAAIDTDPSAPHWQTVKMPAWDLPKKIRWYDKINPIWWLGNCEEPTPPDWYKPEDGMRNMKWYVRNPFSNFTRYVIGVADKDTYRSGYYPTMVENPNGGWNFAITRRKLVILPFISHAPKKSETAYSGLRFYIGWRERGNFGMKFNVTKNSNRRSSMLVGSPIQSSTLTNRCLSPKNIESRFF